MEQLFFPTVRTATVTLHGTAILVLAYKITGLPLVTILIRVVVKQVRLASEVLPIVSVDTLCLIVLLIKRAPFCLKIVHIKV